MPLKPQHVLAELKAPDPFKAGILSQLVTRHVRGGGGDHCSRPPLNFQLESSFDSSLKTSLETSFETSVLIRVVSGAHNVKGRSARQHHTQQHTQRPPVHGEAVVLGPEDLGCDKVRSPAEGGGRVSEPDPLLTHPVVSELDPTLVVQQHIVQFPVPVDDALGAVKPGVLLLQSALPLHVENQITAANKLDHEEESARSLEAGVDTHQEGVIGTGFISLLCFFFFSLCFRFFLQFLCTISFSFFCLNRPLGCVFLRLITVSSELMICDAAQSSRPVCSRDTSRP